MGGAGRERDGGGERRAVHFPNMLQFHNRTANSWSPGRSCLTGSSSKSFTSDAAHHFPTRGDGDRRELAIFAISFSGVIMNALI